MSQSTQALPSARWTSFENWNWGDWGPRLKAFLAAINKPAIVSHASTLIGKTLTLSTPFSAGQYWCCFELVAPDGTLVIARVRLPPLDPHATLDHDYRAACEVATMAYVRDTTDIPVPRVHAYEPPESPRAHAAGAAYMLLEGLRGNSLMDLETDLADLPAPQLHRLLAQWTRIQARLATLTFPRIGAVAAYTPATGPTLGAIATDAGRIGPFDDAVEYLLAEARGRYAHAQKTPPPDADADADARYHRLGPFLHLDIIRRSALFRAHRAGPFPLLHMDIGTQNLLVDAEYNIVGVVDWEMAQTAPWAAHHYQYPFPPADDPADMAAALGDPDHPAHVGYSRIHALQRLYCCKFAEAEAALREEGTPLAMSVAEVLDSDASRAYFMMERHGVDGPVWDEVFARALVRIAYGLDEEGVREYIDCKEAEMEAELEPEAEGCCEG